MHALLIAINSKYVHTALGLRYVGEYAKAQGFDVHLIEETINTPILAVLENIMDVKAEVYAFSVHIWNKLFVYRAYCNCRCCRCVCLYTAISQGLVYGHLYPRAQYVGRCLLIP